MSFHYSIFIPLGFEEAVTSVTQSLSAQGFGIITSINITEVFKQKLAINFRNYKILGACNPNYAYKAITMDSHLGVMLPCNVIVQEHENGQVEISAIVPLQTLDIQSFPHLEELATEVSRRLRAALDDVHAGQRKEHNEALPS